jgi:hypothetical protein
VLLEGGRLVVDVSVTVSDWHARSIFWGAAYVLDPAILGGYLHATLGHGNLFVLTWFVAAAATVGGALGTGLESGEAIRAAAYSKREEERRNRLAHERTLAGCEVGNRPHHRRGPCASHVL